MAKVQLSDVIEVKVFQDMEAEARPEKTALFESGVVVSDPLANQLCAADGNEGELPYWNDLDPTVEPNYSTDQNDLATPLKVGQSSQKVYKSFLNQGWSATDLTRQLQTNTDAMRHIRNRVDTYWTRQWQRRVVATCRGLVEANIADSQTYGSAGDMIVDVSIDNPGAGAPPAANVFDSDAFSAALFTMGDYSDSFSTILVHSVVHKAMVDADDIDYIPDSQNATMIPTYRGHRVIVDDGVPMFTAADPGSFTMTSGIRYVSIIFGPAAFAYGTAPATTPVEVERTAAAGHGGGEEVLWTRKTWLIHPLGYTNLHATVTGANPTAAFGRSQTIADLKLAANWSRTHYRKNVPMAFVISNG